MFAWWMLCVSFAFWVIRDQGPAGERKIMGNINAIAVGAVITSATFGLAAAPAQAVPIQTLTDLASITITEDSRIMRIPE